MKKYIMTKIFVAIMLCLVTYPAFSVPTGGEEIVVYGDRINYAAILSAMQDAFKAWEAKYMGTHQQGDPTLGGIDPGDIPTGGTGKEEEKPCEEEADAMADAADTLATFMSGNSTDAYDEAMAIIEGAILSGVTDASGLSQLAYVWMNNTSNKGLYYGKVPGYTRITMMVQKLADAIDAYSECMESSYGTGAE